MELGNYHRGRSIFMRDRGEAGGAGAAGRAGRSERGGGGVGRGRGRGRRRAGAGAPPRAGLEARAAATPRPAPPTRRGHAPRHAAGPSSPGRRRRHLVLVRPLAEPSPGLGPPVLLPGPAAGRAPRVELPAARPLAILPVHSPPGLPLNFGTLHPLSAETHLPTCTLNLQDAMTPGK